MTQLMTTQEAETFLRSKGYKPTERLMARLTGFPLRIICKNCLKDKPSYLFHRCAKSKKTGRTNTCKECTSASRIKAHSDEYGCSVPQDVKSIREYERKVYGEHGVTNLFGGDAPTEFNPVGKVWSC